MAKNSQSPDYPCIIEDIWWKHPHSTKDNSLLPNLQLRSLQRQHYLKKKIGTGRATQAPSQRGGADSRAGRTPVAPALRLGRGLGEAAVKAVVCSAAADRSGAAGTPSKWVAGGGGGLPPRQGGSANPNKPQRPGSVSFGCSPFSCAVQNLRSFNVLFLRDEP